jgi:hypothetical protein
LRGRCCQAEERRASFALAGPETSHGAPCAGPLGLINVAGRIGPIRPGFQWHMPCSPVKGGQH